MDDVTTTYGPEVIISVHTSKPIDQTIDLGDPTAKKAIPIFWCETCRLKLSTPVAAAQHLCGRSHKARKDGNALKRKIDGLLGESSNKKKNKAHENVDASELKCETCEMVFKTCLMAVQHFKGKKHALKMESAYKQKSVQATPDPKLKCEDCDKEFRSALLAVQHFKGKKHMAKIEAINKEKREPEKEACLSCEVCKKVFPSSLLALQHFQGKKHIKVESAVFQGKKHALKVESAVKNEQNTEPALKKKKEAETTPNSLSCEDCDKIFTTEVSAIDHFKGKKHAAKVSSNVLAARRGKSLRGRGRGHWNGGFDRGYGSFRDRFSNGYQGKPGLPSYNSDSNSWYQGFNNNASQLPLYN